jgi:DNA-binding MarR family transcriptional regulator
MEAQGLVTRTRNPKDERSVTVALTPEGDALRVHGPRIYQVITETFDFTPDRADAALELLQSIVANASKAS